MDVLTIMVSIMFGMVWILSGLFTALVVNEINLIKEKTTNGLYKNNRELKLNFYFIVAMVLFAPVTLPLMGIPATIIYCKNK